MTTISTVRPPRVLGPQRFSLERPGLFPGYMPLLMCPGRLGKTKKTREVRMNSDFSPTDPTFLHIQAWDRRPPCAHLYARIHVLAFANKRVWKCNPLQICDLPLTDGRVRSDENDRNPPCGSVCVLRAVRASLCPALCSGGIFYSSFICMTIPSQRINCGGMGGNPGRL